MMILERAAVTFALTLYLKIDIFCLSLRLLNDGM